MYLTFEDYQTMDGKLEKAAFERYAFRAERKIDECTSGRVKKMEETPNEVSRLMFELVEYFSTHSADVVHIVGKSQTAGAVSESESYDIKDAQAFNDDVEALIVDYLGYELTYRGAAI